MIATRAIEVQHSEVLHKIQEQAVKNRLMVYGIFADFDRLKKGR